MGNRVVNYRSVLRRKKPPSPIKGEKGEPKGIVTVARDITERKQAEYALRESENKYRTLFESSSDAIMTLDENGFIDCNIATLKMFACSQKSEFVSLHPADISPPNQPDGTDSKASADLRIAEAFEKGSAQFEWIHRRKSGQDFPADVLLSAFKLGEKQVLQATVRDITERKKAEEELEKLASVVRHSSELVNLATLDGKMIFLNEAGAKMLGIDLEEVEQINIMQVIPDHLKERTRTEVLSALRGSGTWEGEWQYRNLKTGELIDVHAITFTVKDSRTRMPLYLANVSRDITERKRMGEELRLLSDAVRMTTDSVVVTDMRGRVLEINEAGLRMYGLGDRGDFVGRNPLDAIAPDDRRKAIENMAKIMETGQVNNIEYHVLRKDGSRILIETSVSVIKGGDGEPKGLVAVARDITERKKTEVVLRESEEYFKALMENSLDAVTIINEDGTTRYESPSYERLLGFKPDERVDSNLFDRIHPDDITGVAELFAEFLPNRSDTLLTEVRAQHKDGSWRHIEAIGQNLLDNPIVKGIVINLRDITERKKMEEELRLLSDAVKMSTDSIVVTDLRGRILDANEAALRMYGANSKADFIGRDPFAYIQPEDRKKALGNMAKVMETGYLRDIQYHILTNDGRKTLIETSLSVIKGSSGEPKGLVAVARDITERKRVEEEKQRMEEQLRLAGRLASVGELAAGVAHELNNPIAAIQGFAELLTGRNDLDETMKNDLGIIYREAQRAAKITQNLLSFARRHEPEKHLISLNEVIEKTLELRAYQMKVNNIEVVVEFAPDLPKTMVDFFQMQQVFMNIINNAEQAMLEAHGKGRIVAKTQTAGNMIQATFADNGPGISEETMKRIFDPFFTTKEVGKGTGLGLSICYGIVEAHGGRIYARSKRGEGATVVVEIPIVSEGQ